MMTKLSGGKSLSFKKVAVGVSALILSVAIHAQVRDFNLPPGDLKSVLDAYVAETKQQVVYNANDIKGRTSKGVQGSMTSEKALERLLEGTSLKLRRDSSGAVLIFFGDGSEPGASATIEKLEQVQVFANLSHLGDRSRTGTRMDTDPMATPMMVTTVDKDLLVQQQARTLADALSNVAGVMDLTGTNGFTMRGFGANILRNGNMASTADGSDVPLIALSKLEVVKGPEAIIAGTTAGYGGVVNVITKAPQTQPVTEVLANVGSRGLYELGLDVGRPLNEDKSVLVRLVASKQGAGSTSVGFDGADAKFIAPAITYRNKSTGTEVTAQYEYQDKRATPFPLAITNGTSLSDDLPLLRLEPASDGSRIKTRIATLALNQRIGEDWDLSIKHIDDRRGTDAAAVTTIPGYFFGLPATSQMGLAFNGSNSYVSKINKVELKTDFDTGPLEHRFLVALDLTKSRQDVYNQQTAIYSTDTVTGTVTDLGPTLGAAFGGIPGPVTHGGSSPEEKGLLFMDQVTWGKWTALAGFRVIRFRANNDTQDVGEFRKTLPSLGLVYRVTPTLSLYGSASKGFVPNAGNRTAEGTGVPPENARQFELGAKAMTSDKRLSGSAAFFSIDQKNVAVQDPTKGIFDCGGTVCYLSVPGVKSKGVELEASGELFTHFGIRANYTYLEKHADVINQLGVFWARNQASLWGIYRFRGESTGGWWMGAGVQSRSARLGNTASAIDNPGRSRIDASVGFDANRWSVIAGVKNLTDKRLYTLMSGTFGQGSVIQQREFNLTARYAF